MKRPTATALVLAFLLVLLIWGLTIGFLWSGGKAFDDPDMTEDVKDTLSMMMLGALVAAIGSTIWLGSLITKVVTAPDERRPTRR